MLSTCSKRRKTAFGWQRQEDETLVVEHVLVFEAVRWKGAFYGRGPQVHSLDESVCRRLRNRLAHLRRVLRSQEGVSNLMLD